MNLQEALVECGFVRSEQPKPANALQKIYLPRSAEEQMKDPEWQQAFQEERAANKARRAANAAQLAAQRLAKRREARRNTRLLGPWLRAYDRIRQWLAGEQS